MRTAERGRLGDTGVFDQDPAELEAEATRLAKAAEETEDFNEKSRLLSEAIASRRAARTNAAFQEIFQIRKENTNG